MNVSASTTTRLDYEVNTFNESGDAVLHVGSFTTVEAARVGIETHAVAPPNSGTYGAAVLPSIVESWGIGGTVYVVHHNACPVPPGLFRVTRRRAGEYAVRADKSGFPLLEIERSQESEQWFVANGSASRLAGEFACVS